MALLVEEWYTLCQEEIEMMNLKSLRRGFLFAAAMFCAMGPRQDVYGAQRAPIQERRLEEDMEIGPGNPGPAADLASLTCTIDGNQIKIAGTVWGSEEELKRYDHYWYLFELAPYEDQLNGRTDYEAWWNRGDAISCALPLTDEDGSDRLYSRFVLAIYDGRTYRIVSKPAYITNPEALAGNKAEFMRRYYAANLSSTKECWLKILSPSYCVLPGIHCTFIVAHQEKMLMTGWR